MLKPHQNGVTALPNAGAKSKGEATKYAFIAFVFAVVFALAVIFRVFSP